MTPLIVDQRTIGGINIKMSPAFLDDRLTSIYRNMGIVVAGLTVLIFGLVSFFEGKARSEDPGFSSAWRTKKGRDSR